MDQNVKTLSGVIDNFSIFNQIVYLFASNTLEATVVGGFTTAKNLFMTVTMPKNDNFDTPVCLADVPFLKKILNMALEKDGVLTFERGTSLNGDDILSRMIVSTTDLSVSYATTDPKVVASKIPSDIRASWSDKFEINLEDCEKFSEAHSLQRMIAKKEDEQLVKFSCVGGQLSAYLPYTKSDGVTVVLNSKPDNFVNGAYFSAAYFNKMLQVVKSASGATVTLADNMMHVNAIVTDVSIDMYLQKTNTKDRK